jgi:Rieske Fe-S protein
MERRDFLKDTCSLCLALGAGALSASLASCGSYPVYDAPVARGTIAIPLSAFRDTDLQIVRAGAFPYDIALRRTGEGYSALVLRCTHADTPLVPAGGEFLCTAHGSRFGSEGDVRRGPAERELEHLPVTISGSAVIIRLEG